MPRTVVFFGRAACLRLETPQIQSYENPIEDD